MIAVVDCGVNNLRSVVRALAAGGHAAELTGDPAVVGRATHVLVPGVGHFQQAMHNLRTSGLDQAIRDAAAAGRPVLGICLGQQLFFEESEEAPGVRGLDILPGKVVRFQVGMPVPHVGWAEVRLTLKGEQHPLLGPLFAGEPEFFYHVHSYHPAESGEAITLGTGDYAGPFSTIVGRDNVLGVQFHPEKSQQAGLDLLSAFAEWQP